MMLRVPPNTTSQGVCNTESEKEKQWMNTVCEWIDDGGANAEGMIDELPRLREKTG